LGIVALREPDRFRRFRESLKDLLSLGSITQEQMRERLLTLAGVSVDVPALDVRKLFGDDYDKIRQHRDALARFKKNEEQVQLLVECFGELKRIGGELVSRWTDLRDKKIVFEKAHEEAIKTFREQIATQIQKFNSAVSELAEWRQEAAALSERKGGIKTKLDELSKLDGEFSGFLEDMERAALTNLQNEIRSLDNQLAEARSELRSKAEEKISIFGQHVKQKEETIRRFDQLAITGLRKEFTDDELNRLFHLLNRDILEIPIGADGIKVISQQKLVSSLRDLLNRVEKGVYHDANVTIKLRSHTVPLAGLENVESARVHLDEYRETLGRWQKTLKAIEQREELERLLKEKQNERDGEKNKDGEDVKEGLAKRIFRFEEYKKSKTEEPRFHRDLGLINDEVDKVNKKINGLDQARISAQTAEQSARTAITKEENGFNAVMGRFGQCVFPELSAKAIPVDELPKEFDSAIALFLNRQGKEGELKKDVESSLKIIAQLVGEQFNGADEAETIKNLADELEALPEKTEALERNWNALIQGLRGQFSNVLKELDEVRNAASDLTRQFDKVQVSNLQSIRLEVLDAGDVVSWIKRLVNLEQPGLFEDGTQLDQTLRNFREKIQGSPLISFSQLFSLQFAITGADGVIHRYQDFRQIESDGTTIAIKVLFNLLILRRYLREDQCVVPFFLDEIQTLDPANRSAVLSMARKLGFIAITAAPEAVSEVDALYFLQAVQGRIVLGNRHRVGVKPK
ncbi:MAG: hypothetical protein ABIP71_15730, partial [Verrucomicrobiota bacterium]